MHMECQLFSSVNIYFVFNILNGYSNYSELLELVNFYYVPRALRNTPLSSQIIQVYPLFNDPITRICEHGNQVADRVNFYGACFGPFKHAVISSLRASVYQT